ncbi:MAG: hypothetical protein HPY50_03165 [Firmicutes bacterium]|nr:hypothetical protein [Bacillota bacterium]
MDHGTVHSELYSELPILKNNLTSEKKKIVSSPLRKVVVAMGQRGVVKVTNTVYEAFDLAKIKLTIYFFTGKVHYQQSLTRGNRQMIQVTVHCQERSLFLSASFIRIIILIWHRLKNINQYPLTPCSAQQLNLKKGSLVSWQLKSPLM